MTRRRALVTATLSRRSPPARFSGPKLSGRTPWRFFEKPVEKRMTSRSSPCTFSRFFTKRPSLPRASDSTMASIPLSHNIFSMRVRCCRLKVTMPIERSPAAQRRSTSPTTAWASTGLVRNRPPSPERWKVPSTRCTLTPVSWVWPG